MRKILGIDLGTTNSAVAVWNGHAPCLIPVHHLDRLLPSVVAFGDNDELFVGAVAQRQAIVNAGRTIYSSKRFLGRPFAAVADDRESVPYEVAEGPDGETCFHVDYMLVTPEEIAAVLLLELRRAAEAFIGEPIDSAVIAVPAHFNDAQRTATKEAGCRAGLNVLRLINEPTAAALAYGLGKVPDRERIVAVYDFGGGTFDVSILSVAEDVVEVIATNGDTHLGGDLIDGRIARLLLDHFEAQTGTPVDEDAETFQRLREVAERAKVALSAREVVDIDLPFLEVDGDGPVHLEYSLSRDDLNEMIGDLVERTLACCDQVLADAGRVPREIDEVVLVGGSSRIPMVQDCVASYFGRQPRHNVYPEEVVALGAAVEAAVLSGELKGVVLIDVTSLSLGIETHDGLTSVVTPRNTTIPVTATRVFTTSRDDQVDVQFHVVQGEEKRAGLNDSLGRFVLDGLRPAKAGEVRIEVSLTINTDGMVQVRAKDLETGREQSVTVSAATAARPRPFLGVEEDDDAGLGLVGLGQLPPACGVEREAVARARAVSGATDEGAARPCA